jgi:hypothetical protein
MHFLSELRKRFYWHLELANAPLVRLAEHQLILQSQSLARLNRRRTRLHGIQDAEFCAFSQWGEDGIIDWLVERLPGIPSSFVEFGVSDYKESNTRLLLQLRNWTGLVIDGSPEYVDNIRKQEIHWRHNLTSLCAYIHRDNINRLIADAGYHESIGILSVDIDGNDYWVWDVIEVVDPVIVICEYNAVFGDRYSLTVPYAQNFDRTQAHHSNLYFGASIQALLGLAQRKGYTFVGTTSSGCNAFFVRNDRAPGVVAALDGIWAFPSATRESRDPDGRLTFVSGPARAQVIGHLPLLDLRRGGETNLASCPDLYSHEWSTAAKVKLVANPT